MIQDIFPVLNYSLLFLTDLFSLQVENILIAKEGVYSFNLVNLSLPAKMVWGAAAGKCADRPEEGKPS